MTVHGAETKRPDADDRYVVVSIDTHVGPSVKDQLVEYCEAEHREAFAQFVSEMEQHGLLSWRSSEADRPGERQSWELGRRLDPDQMEKFAEAAGIRNPDQVDARFMQRSFEASLRPGLQDPSARLADMDASGVAAGVIYHGGLNGQSIPFSTTGLIAWGDTRYNHLEPAGVRIYNRWLADFVSSAPDRHIGVAHIPVSDPDACVREAEWAAEAGLKGINLPAPRGDFAMLNDPVWEPLWSVCEEAGLSLNTHGGGGEHFPYKGDGAQSMYMMETTFRTRRGVWVLILGGVFERHPGLKLVMTEQWMDWAPQVMADMDGLHTGPGGAHLRKTLPRAPSEYFRENCFIGASFLSNWEAKLGIDANLAANTMWGDDYPHAEGSWPHTRESMRFTFCDIDPTYVQQYLGDTAIDVYGLDRTRLEAIAANIGPTVGEIATPFEPPADDALGLYAFRTGPGIFT